MHEKRQLPGRLAVAVLLAASFASMGLGMYYNGGKVFFVGVGLFFIAVMTWPWLLEIELMDENPYRAPQADVSQTRLKRPSKRFWTIILIQGLATTISAGTVIYFLRQTSWTRILGLAVVLVAYSVIVYATTRPFGRRAPRS